MKLPNNQKGSLGRRAAYNGSKITLPGPPDSLKGIEPLSPEERYSLTAPRRRGLVVSSAKQERTDAHALRQI